MDYFAAAISPSKLSCYCLYYPHLLVPINNRVLPTSYTYLSIPLAAVYGVGLRRLASWDYGFESRRGHGCFSLVIVMCFRLEISATGWSLVQRSPTGCGVSVCDFDTSTVRRPRASRAVEPWKNIYLCFFSQFHRASWYYGVFYLSNWCTNRLL
jgi:hypothetical protein